MTPQLLKLLNRQPVGLLKYLLALCPGNRTYVAADEAEPPLRNFIYNAAETFQAFVPIEVYEKQRCGDLPFDTITISHNYRITAHRDTIQEADTIILMGVARDKKVSWFPTCFPEHDKVFDVKPGQLLIAKGEDLHYVGKPRMEKDGHRFSIAMFKKRGGT